MIKPGFLILCLVLLLCAVLGLSGCGSNGGMASEGDLLDQAAQEATAIVQQAQATALVLQAHAQATAVVIQANAYTPESVSEATWMAYVPGAESTEEVQTQTLDNLAPDVTEEISQTVEVVSVGFAGEGGFIIVRFYAPPDVAEHWWQGSVSVEDESSGAIYNEIPEMPKIGPLIGRPKIEGQIGYVMLVNAPPGLRTGMIVTVTLGEYRFEHIPVQ